MANVTAMVKSLRAEEGTEVSRLARVVAAMEKVRLIVITYHDNYDLLLTI